MTHHMVSIDTEFPGVVYRPATINNRCLGKLPPFLNYQIMLDKVNDTNIIQLGLTLWDDNGSLCNFGTPLSSSGSSTSTTPTSTPISKTWNPSTYSNTKGSISILQTSPLWWSNRYCCSTMISGYILRCIWFSHLIKIMTPHRKLPTIWCSLCKWCASPLYTDFMTWSIWGSSAMASMGL